MKNKFCFVCLFVAKMKNKSMFFNWSVSTLRTHSNEIRLLLWLCFCPTIQSFKFEK
jgi:hypothetical protein